MYWTRNRKKQVWICSYIEPPMKNECYIDLCDYCIEKRNKKYRKEYPYNKSRVGYWRKSMDIKTCKAYVKYCDNPYSEVLNKNLICNDCGFTLRGK